MPCTINGIKSNFIFDTGADGLGIDSSFYSKNLITNYPKSTELTLNGATGNKQTIRQITDKVIFFIEKMNFKSDYTIVGDFKPVFNNEMSGVIGWNFFKDYIIQINYVNKTMDFVRNNEYIDNNYDSIPLILENGFIYVDMKIVINNKLILQGKYILDTGYGGSVILTSTVSDDNKFDSIIKNKIPFSSKKSAIGGGVSGFCFRADSIKLGNHIIPVPVIEYSSNKYGLLANRGGCIGIIGNRILEKFDVIFDFKNLVLYIKPNTNFHNKIDSIRYNIKTL